MSAKAMYDLKDTLCTELDQFAKKGNISGSELTTVHLITDTIKNIDKIISMDEAGYSYGDGNWVANGSYSNGMPYNRSRSYGDDRMSGRRSGNYYSNDAYDMESRMRKDMNY